MDPGPAPPYRMRFGAFEVDLKAGELLADGTKIRLQEKPYQILRLLLEQPGEIITREEIQKRLWPENTFVEFEHSINAAVKRLRTALGDSAEHPRYIETVGHRGYRFIAPVETARRAVTEVETQPGAAKESDLQSSPTGRGWSREAETGEGAVAPVSPPAEPVAAVSDRRAAMRTSLRQRRLALAGASLVAVIAVLLTLNVAGLRERFMTTVGARHGVPVPKIQSIAVLPLENLSHDPEQEYFADGMTEELITNLGKTQALRVISRTSVMQYKGTKKPLPQIARELNVDGIVEGTVLRSGNRVRITANLLHGPTDRHLWADSYESDLGDVLILQGEVARSIANEVRIKVTPEEQARLTPTRTVNPEAHEAYLKGRFLLSRWALSHGDTEAQQVDNIAREYFQSALKKDPNYAPGYAGISLVGRSHKEAKAAALKALELDNDLADAHEALARVLFAYEWDWAAAEKEFKRAIELNPNSGELRVLYMAFLHVMRRPQEARAQIERARQLDPLNPRIQHWYVLHFMFSRQYDAAIAQAREMLRVAPDATGPHVFLQSAFRAKGLFPEWFAEIKKAHADDPEIVEAMDRGYARGGYREAMRLAAKTLEKRCSRTCLEATGIAVLYTNAGDNNRAMEWLEKAYADKERSGNVLFLGVAPDFDPLRSDPRFQALLRKMNLPP